MNIALFELETSEHERVKQALGNHQLRLYTRPLGPKDIGSLLYTEILGVFIYSNLTAEVLSQFPYLKCVVTMSTGFDHIDINFCRKGNIRVCNVPKYGGISVAEHTFALILALARKLNLAFQKTTHDDFSLEGLMGTNLREKTLGVIGAGTIGIHVIEIAKAFGMQVLAYEPHRDYNLAKKLGFSYASIGHIFSNSDIVTLHVPHAPNTHHFINASLLKRMKPTAFLINTARGALIDTPALAKALENGQLAGAALDVLEGEAAFKEAHQALKQGHHQTTNWRLLRRTHSLLKRPNVIVTPHTAFYTKEAMEVIIKTTINNIRAFASGAPQNIVS